MKYIVQALLALLVAFYGIHLNLVREQEARSLDQLNSLIGGLTTQNRKLVRKIDELEVRNQVHEYFTTRRVNLTPEEARGVSETILEASEKYDIAPDLLLALIQTESSFDKNAISSQGAIGLMQLLPSTASEVARELDIEWPGDHALHDPMLNVELGSHYLWKLLERFRDLDMALAAYHIGPERLTELLSQGIDYSRGFSSLVYREQRQILGLPMAAIR